MKIIKSDIKRALTSWGFWAGSAGMIIAILIGASEAIVPVIQKGIGEGLPEGFHAQTLLTALSSDIMLLSVPILCALPFTSAFVDDYKSGFIKQYLPRSGRGSYIKGKLVATGISGGLTLFLGIMFMYFVFALVFMPMELVPRPVDAAVASKSMETAGMQQPGYFAQILLKAFVFFLSGAFWSLTGALMSCITMSKYMAYASPFIIFYILVILNERYIKELYVLNPKDWLSPNALWPGEAWGVILILIELIFIVSLVFSLHVSRRLSNA